MLTPLPAALPSQHWFNNRSAHTNDHPYTHALYNLKQHNKPSTSSSTNIANPPSSTKQMFGTSIFGHQNGLSANGEGLMSPRSPCLLYHTSTQAMAPESVLRETSPSPLARLMCSTPPPPQMLNDDASDEMTHITHLIKHLSYTIQEMNQFLDAHQGPDSKRAGVTKKTTNCRNEMVSTLSYYQTYIQSNSPRLRSHTNSRSPRSPIPYHNEEDRMPQSLLSPSSQQSHSMYPSHSTQRPIIDQCAEYSRLAFDASNQGFSPSASNNGTKKGSFSCRPHCNGKTSSSSNSNAKQIALDVVGNVIGTPGPMMRDSSIVSQLTHMETPDMIASAFAQTANSQTATMEEEEQQKSTLNAYAQPYQTQNAFPQQQTPQQSQTSQANNSRSTHHHSTFQMTHGQHQAIAPPVPPALHHQAVQQQRVQQHPQAVNVPTSSQYITNRRTQPQQAISPPAQQYVDRSGSMQSASTTQHQRMPPQYTTVQSAAEQYQLCIAAQQQRVATATAPKPVVQIVQNTVTAPIPRDRRDEQSSSTPFRTTTANGYTTTHTAPGFVRPPSKAQSQNRTPHINGYSNSNGHSTNGAVALSSELKHASNLKMDDECRGNTIIDSTHSSPTAIDAVQEVSENHGDGQSVQSKVMDTRTRTHPQPHTHTHPVTVRRGSSHRSYVSQDEHEQTMLCPERVHDENVSNNRSSREFTKLHRKSKQDHHTMMTAEVEEDIDFEDVMDVAPESLFNGSSAFDGVETCDIAPSHTLSQGDRETRRPVDYSPHSDPVLDGPIQSNMNGDRPHPNPNANAIANANSSDHQMHHQEQGESSSNPFCGDSPNTNSITTNTNSTKSTSPKRPIKNVKGKRTVKSGTNNQSTPKSNKSGKTAAQKSDSAANTKTKPALRPKVNGKVSHHNESQSGSSKLSGTKSTKAPSGSLSKGSHHETTSVQSPVTKSGANPLWSSIAKNPNLKKASMTKLTQKKLCSASGEEKTPEGSITDSDYSQFNVNRKHSTNYWRNRTNSNNNYQSSLSTSSYSSASSKDNHITPSPTPPESKRRRDSKKSGGRSSGSGTPPKSGGSGSGSGSGSGGGANERCRVFVSNLPPNVTDEDIRAAFMHCGDIANTVWFPSRTDGKFYGSGLITFSRHSGSENALRLNQQNVLGRIIRVEYSSCQDPVKVKPPGCRTIYLNNVPRDAQESRIRQVFKHCGRIKRVRFHERDTKRTGGAFVEFEHTASCDKALALHGKIVDHHPLYVDYQRY